MYSLSDLKIYDFEKTEIMDGRPPYAVFINLPKNKGQSAMIKVNSEMRGGKPYTMDNNLQRPLSELNEGFYELLLCH